MNSRQSLVRLLIFGAALSLGATATTATVLRRHVVVPAGLIYGRVYLSLGEPIIGTVTNPAHTTRLSAGYWAGILIAPGPPTTGACCGPAGECTVTTAAECLAPSIWLGGGTNCDPNPCPDPSGVRPGAGLPRVFAFDPAKPNPVRGTAMLRYAVPTTARVVIRLYNVQGRAVETLVDADLRPGFHTATWNASRLPAGFYFGRMAAPGFTQTRRLLLLK